MTHNTREGIEEKTVEQANMSFATRNIWESLPFTKSFIERHSDSPENAECILRKLDEYHHEVVSIFHQELQKAREEMEGLLKSIYDYNQMALEFWHKDATTSQYSSGRMWQAKEMQQYLLDVFPTLKDQSELDQDTDNYKLHRAQIFSNGEGGHY